MSDRTPNDAYLKSRRALVVASGLLALSLLSGITQNDTDRSLTIFSFKLNSPENIPLIFLIVTLYLIWQFWSAWLVQSDDVRRSRINRLDVFLSFLISIGAIGIWCWPYLLRLIDSLSGERLGTIATSAVAVATGIGISIFASYLLLKASTRAKEVMLVRGLMTRAFRKNELIDVTMKLLVSKEWLLVFNPKNKRSKRISFLEDGAIGAGRNHNEHYWRVVNGRLEILNSERSVFSHFTFNEALDRFEHTNDGDTLSIRDQVIVPAPA